ncbi:hypothetical protein BSKO_11733 [Bryopsis sp. KO-2023]|nr:hypothetical protein BSKO_11733 [Bryopsis sp. KO-2023]
MEAIKNNHQVGHPTKTCLVACVLKQPSPYKVALALARTESRPMVFRHCRRLGVARRHRLRTSSNLTFMEIFQVPIVLPIFTKKYALKISIAYEIPGDEDPSADVSAATSAQIRGRSLLQSREPTHGAYFSINLEKKDGKEVLDFCDNVKLVFDEVHHAKAQAPYKKILEHYNKAKKLNEGCLPKVLGFTSTPTNDKTMEGTEQKLDGLLDLLQAEFVHVSEEHHEIQQYVPKPKERVIYIEPHDNKAPTIAEELIAFFSKSNERAAAESYLEDHPELSSSNIDKLATVELLASAQLLQESETSLQVLKEFGYEPALAYFARKCVEAMETMDTSKSNLEGASVSSARGDGVFQQMVYLLCKTAPVNDTKFVTSAIGRDVLCHGESFPKFVELLRFLENEYVRKRGLFHGIISIETRSGVHHLARMLRSDPRMNSIDDFIEFTGRGSTKRSDLAKGMTGKKQKEQLSLFREPGRKILVATPAAEEGLDIQTCEFVIRYTAPKSGIQKVQSKGRTRKEGSIYVSLIIKNSSDEKMDAKLGNGGACSPSTAVEKLVSQGKPVWQSSIDFSGYPKRAVDGNTDSGYFSGSCTHTKKQKNPWWRVDLGATYQVTKVVITNRGDCCSERLHNFAIYIGSEVSSNYNQWCAEGQKMGPGETRTYSCPMVGRHVSIKIWDTEYLTLCEVQVYAKVAASAQTYRMIL